MLATILWMHLLDPWSRVFLVNLRVTQLSQDSPSFMETADSLTCSQEPTTGPYPKADASSPHSPANFPKVHLILSYHFRPDLTVNAEA